MKYWDKLLEWLDLVRFRERHTSRRKLANLIYNITPEETPFFDLIAKAPRSKTHPEWKADA